jgi:hypothetical protein
MVRPDVEARFRNADGSEFIRELAEPLAPKFEIEGRTYLLIKGVSGSDESVYAVYEEAPPDDR